MKKYILMEKLGVDCMQDTSPNLSDTKLASPHQRYGSYSKEHGSLNSSFNDSYSSAIIEMAHALTYSPIVLGANVDSFLQLEELKYHKEMINRIKTSLKSISYGIQESGQIIGNDDIAQFMSFFSEDEIGIFAKLLQNDLPKAEHDIVRFIPTTSNFYQVCMKNFKNKETDKEYLKGVCQLYYGENAETLFTDMYDLMLSLSYSDLTESEYNDIIKSVCKGTLKQMCAYTLCYIFESRSAYNLLLESMKRLHKTYFYFLSGESERECYQYDYGQLVSVPDYNAPYQMHNLETKLSIEEMISDYNDMSNHFFYKKQSVSAIDLRNELLGVLSDADKNTLLSGYSVSKLKDVLSTTNVFSYEIKGSPLEKLHNKLKESLNEVFENGEYLNEEYMSKITLQCFEQIVSGEFVLYPGPYSKDYSENIRIIKNVFESLNLVEEKGQKREILEDDGHDYFYEMFFDNCLELLAKSASDYAAVGSRFVNFEQVALFGGQTREMVLYLYMAKHFQALGQYVQGAANESREPILGRIQDIVNYSALLAKMIDENKAQQGV